MFWQPCTGWPFTEKLIVPVGTIALIGATIAVTATEEFSLSNKLEVDERVTAETLCNREAILLDRTLFT
jgi:hypothetical protein